MVIRRLIIAGGWCVGLSALTAGVSGCTLECRAQDRNPVKEVVDEVGDEVEDVANEVKKP